jgi:hypothetical protein
LIAAAKGEWLAGMSRVIEGCRAKLRRAEADLEELGNQWQAFLDQRPYKFVVKHSQASYLDIEWMLATVPPLELSVLAGEVAHNLRSCLDQLVWPIASVRYRKIRGKPPGPGGANIMFPMETGMAVGFKNAPTTRYLGPALAVVRKHQPYRRGKVAAHSHPLAWLKALSNEDKHRAIHAAAVYPDPQELSAAVYVPPEFEIVRKRFHFKQGQPLESGAKIARIHYKVAPTVGDLMGGRPPLGMHGDFEIAVAFGDTPPGALEDIHEYVSGVVDDFEPLLP